MALTLSKLSRRQCWLLWNRTNFFCNLYFYSISLWSTSSLIDPAANSLASTTIVFDFLISGRLVVMRVLSRTPTIQGMFHTYILKVQYSDLWINLDGVNVNYAELKAN